MGYVISLANSKGGVGKTTSCLSIGCCLAEMGKKTLLIDLDHQANLSIDFGRGDEEKTITDLFDDRKLNINEIIYPALDNGKEIENLDIIPADLSLANQSRIAERFTYPIEILGNAIKKIKNKYDYILLDLRPAIDLPTENGLVISDLTIIPIDMDKRAVIGISDLLEVIGELKRGKDFEFKILKTKVNKSHKIMLEATNKRISDKNYCVANTEIRMSELYKQATEKNRPAPLFAKNEKPHEDYKALTAEIVASIEE